MPSQPSSPVRQRDRIIVGAMTLSFVAYLVFSNGLHNHVRFLYESAVKILAAVGP